jgi:hypothetical protein
MQFFRSCLRIVLAPSLFLFRVNGREHEPTTATQEKGNNDGRVSHTIHQFVEDFAIGSVLPQGKGPHNGPRENKEI